MNMTERRIAIPFDGTVMTFDSGWQGPTGTVDPPVPGAIEFVRDLVNAGFTVYLVSERIGMENGLFAVKSYLTAYGLSQFHINSLRFVSVRPAGVSAVDRFAFGFPGNFPSIDHMIPSQGLYVEPHKLGVMRNAASALELAAEYLKEAATDLRTQAT